MFAACSSDRKPTKSCRLRPSRSTLQAITTLNCRRAASQWSASNAGLFSRPLAPLMPWVAINLDHLPAGADRRHVPEGANRRPGEHFLACRAEAAAAQAGWQDPADERYEQS
jgi:hypothetical protein